MDMKMIGIEEGFNNIIYVATTMLTRLDFNIRMPAFFTRWKEQDIVEWCIERMDITDLLKPTTLKM